MKREIVNTKDGSTTIHLPEWNESYHSKHGAVQEAYHVFIKNGFSLFEGKPISILEIGFGTGLNCFITYLETLKTGQPVEYVGVEAYPVTFDEAVQMNFAEKIDAANNDIFCQMHKITWGKKHELSAIFSLQKRKQYFEDIVDENSYDVVYFDAFGSRVQPELWSAAMFLKMFKALKTNGVLVTYACKASIKKAMTEAGFSIETLPGAPGKREMLRATKKI